jgi:hypothetical protein
MSEEQEKVGSKASAGNEVSARNKETEFKEAKAIEARDLICDRQDLI